MDLGPAIVELLQHRIGDGAADAATHYADLFLALSLSGLTQRTDEIVQAITLLLVAELFRGGAHGLHDDRNGALFPVIVMDGDGDTLAIFIHPQDDELARLCLLGHHGSLDLIQDHGRLQGCFCNNAIHTLSSFLVEFFWKNTVLLAGSLFQGLF